MVKKKREALTVTRLINEVLVSQLSIPLRQIVNDTTFQNILVLNDQIYLFPNLNTI